MDRTIFDPTHPFVGPNRDLFSSGINICNDSLSSIHARPQSRIISYSLAQLFFYDVLMDS